MKSALRLLAAAIAAAVAVIKALPATNAPVLWVVPHTHWEGAVFKTREDYLETGLANILTALRLLRENPNYRFALDQVAYFRPFLERYPEHAADFRRFVAEGRLQIVGSLMVMPDDNMPSGESFVRQIFYGKHFAMDALGTDVRTGWLLDTFGHNAQLPQLLRLGGYNSFWFFRGVEDRSSTPSEFLWEGVDGTRIPAFWLPFAYGHAWGSPADAAGFDKFMQERYDALAPFSKHADRVALDGVDVSEPELHLPQLAGRPGGSAPGTLAVKIATPVEFEAVAAAWTDRPVVRGERNPLFQGVYSSRIEMKQRMREAERLLTSAEKINAFTLTLRSPNRNADLAKAWDPALFNVTHDLASGVMTDPVYEDTLKSYEYTLRTALALVEGGLDDIARATDTTGPGAPLLVFNTLGWSRTDLVETEAAFDEAGVVDIRVSDDKGRPVPCQIIDSEPFADGGIKRAHIAFNAIEVPPMGYAVYHVTGSRQASPAPMADSGAVLENDAYRATVDPRTGAIAGIIVKNGGWEALRNPANVVAVEPDHGDFWELYKNLDGFQNTIVTRPMPAPTRDGARLSTDAPGKPGIFRKGPVFQEFEGAFALGTNTVTTTVRLPARSARIEIVTRIINREPFVRYRLLTPVAVANGRNTQEIPFGAVERPLSQEFPAQNWMDHGDAHRGVAVFNRGMPGNNDADGVLLLSLLRSTRIQSYGIGGGFEGQGSDSGLELNREVVLRSALAPHKGDWRDAGIAHAALEFNNPLIARKTSAHPGKRPHRDSLLEAGPAAIIMSAVKRSDDGDLIVRVYESTGRPAPDARIQFHRPVRAAWTADLLENGFDPVPVRRDQLRFAMHAFEIKTFRVRLEPTR
jgi:alpha-mannosidase